MVTHSFTISSRFRVEPSLSLITNLDSGLETRLEPRLIRLLCLLHDRAGELVSREDIAREIWDDYGGADEGLTQAISFLRKVLGDESRTLIETIPKKGYRLKKTTTATAPVMTSPPASPAPTKPLRPGWVSWLVTSVLLLLAVWFIIRNLPGKPAATSPDQTQTPQKRSGDSTSSDDKVR